MSFKILLNKNQVTDVLRNLLGNPQESLNRDGERLALKGEHLTQEEADQILADYEANKPALEADAALTKKLEAIVGNAMAFGQDVMKRYGAQNIKSGKTEEQIDQILVDLAGIINALVSGSLKSAKRQAEAFTPTDAVPQEDIDWFVAELTSYLGS